MKHSLGKIRRPALGAVLTIPLAAAPQARASGYNTVGAKGGYMKFANA
jgi:hypothetical protein